MEPGLQVLVALCLRPLEEELDEASPPSTPGSPHSEQGEGAEADGAPKHVSGTASREVSHVGIAGGPRTSHTSFRSRKGVEHRVSHAPSSTGIAIPEDKEAGADDGEGSERSEGSEGDAEQAQAESQAALEAQLERELAQRLEAALPPQENLLDLHADIYSTAWRRKCAADVLCSLLVRDVEGRCVHTCCYRCQQLLPQAAEQAAEIQHIRTCFFPCVISVLFERSVGPLHPSALANCGIEDLRCLVIPTGKHAVRTRRHVQSSEG